MEVKKRNYKIDNLRGIAIFLVVLGHSMILYQKGWGYYKSNIEVPFLEQLKNIIDVIQMPLFISLSGFLFSYSASKTNLKKIVSGKAKRILIPYIIFSVFWMVPIRKMAHYTPYSGKNIINIIVQNILLCKDNGHLWFLPFLFVCFVIFYLQYAILNKLKMKRRTRNIILLLMGYFIYLEWWRIPQNIYGEEVFRSVGIYYFWFVMGFVINEFVKKQQKKDIDIRIKIVSGIIASVLIYGYIIGKFLSIFILRIIIVVTLFMIVPEKNNKILGFLSKKSFGIYLFHSPLVYIVFDQMAGKNPWLVISINMIVCGGLAVGLTILVGKTKYLKAIIGE